MWMNKILKHLAVDKSQDDRARRTHSPAAEALQTGILGLFIHFSARKQ